jgi:hypothetical protein
MEKCGISWCVCVSGLEIGKPSLETKTEKERKEVLGIGL